jgi:hypothetical protein
MGKHSARTPALRCCRAAFPCEISFVYLDAPHKAWMLPSYLADELGDERSLVKPRSKEQFLAERQRWRKEGFAGVINENTRLRYKKSVRHFYVSGDDIHPIVEILEGEFRGWSMSVHYVGKIRYRHGARDPEFFAPAKN